MRKRRTWAEDFVHTCRKLGMTDDEIRAKMVAQLPTVRRETMALEPMPAEPDTNTELRQAISDDIDNEVQS
jgi:hypothetical protein